MLALLVSGMHACSQRMYIRESNVALLVPGSHLCRFCLVNLCVVCICVRKLLILVFPCYGYIFLNRLVMESSTFASRMKVCGARRERNSGFDRMDIVGSQGKKEREGGKTERKKEGSKERNTVAEREENIDRRRGFKGCYTARVKQKPCFVSYYICLFSSFYLLFFPLSL